MYVKIVYSVYSAGTWTHNLQNMSLHNRYTRVSAQLKKNSLVSWLNLHKKQFYLVQKFTLKLLIAFKKAYSCWLSLGEKLTYSRFRPKTFYNIGTWEEH